MKTLKLLLLMAFYSLLAFGQDGTLDHSFNYDGKVTTDIGITDDFARSVAIQSDGKILLAGFSNTGSNFDFSLVRYNTNGTLDDSFGIDGKVTTAIGYSDDRGFSIAIQSDEKIVLAGDFHAGPYMDFALARYHKDGTLDTSFGTNGRVTTAIGNTDDFAHSVLIQEDQKILVGGYSRIGTDYDFVLVRYNTDGTLDTTFDTDGKVITDFQTQDRVHHDRARAMAIQPDGKILLAGDARKDFAVARYNSDGSLDSTFGLNGKVTTVIGSGFGRGYALIIQNDGKILLGGETPGFVEDYSRDFAIVRYNIDGTLDATFGNGGIVITDFDDFDDVLSSLSIQADGKIVACGYTAPVFGGTGPEPSFFVLARYNTDGTLDGSFGTNGKITTRVGNYSNVGYCSVIQGDGKIVLGGWSYNGNDFDFAAARYTTDLNVGIIDFTVDSPLFLVYPNPLKQHATIEYTLKQDELLSIELYDLSGHLVQAFLMQEKRKKGTHTEVLNIKESLPSNNYILAIRNTAGVVSIKLVVNK